MDKLERKRFKECRREKCPNAELGKCRIYWGNQCNRLGGNKIPRLITKYEFLG
jgi:hypothetical protein